MYRKTFIVILLALVTACGAGVPEKGSTGYAGAIKSFYVGLAAMEAADEQRARSEIVNATSLAPGEPAAWGNLAVLQMRQKDLKASAASLEKARQLAPDDGQIYRNIYVLATQQGDFDTAVKSLKRAIEINPADVRAQFALGREYGRLNDDAGALAAYEKVAAAKPDNLPTLIEIVRIAAKQGDAAKVRQLLSGIKPANDTWDTEIRTQFELLNTAASGDVRQVSQGIGFFRNVLLRLPKFRAEIEEVAFDETFVGEPFLKPLRLAVPDFRPAPADEFLTFKPEAIASQKARWCKAVYLDGDSAPAVAWATDTEVRAGERALSVGLANDIQTIDIDYDLRNDLVIVGDNGVRFFDGAFQEITAKTKLAPDLTGRKYLKAFTFDVDIDGDLDLILTAETGAPVVLQNNADGTFAAISLFTEISGLRDLAVGDIDEDGDIDVAAVDSAGEMRVYSNERGRQFTPRNSPSGLKARAVAFADTNADSKLDLNVLATDGVISRLTDVSNGRGWEVARLAKTDTQTAANLLIQDLDNNGANDLVAGDRVFLAAPNGEYSALSSTARVSFQSAAGLGQNGRLDIIGLDADAKPTIFSTNGTKNYGWQVFRPRSAKAEGDQRVNSFGIGGEMEIRSGLMAQKRVIDAPQVHFGLGEQAGVDLLRVVWGNGFTQAEFDMARDQAVTVGQRLTGSCPHLFAWNGTEFKFVKDAAPLATSLGLRVSNDVTVPVTQTEEWYKIPGENLVARDGFYEIRITDELWESYYVDHYRLLAVDHPAETDVFANELYPVPPPLELHATANPRPFASATDDKGNDVSASVAALDENYLGGFDKTQYQGVVEEHFVELELPADAPADKAIKIIADGWLHPTDTSLNVAISQNSAPKPKTLSLDILTESGEWKPAIDDLGVPASKFKTVVIDLPNGTRRCRLRTNSEVYWDRLAWAVAIPDATNEVTRLDLAHAELGFHGFSAVSKKDNSSPETADYETIATTNQRWRSIEGYYTRYGDILELLSQTDDRYALVASGDEMILKFRELPPVRPGWKRDFVMVGDGWIKEGDYNNVFSQTILPLPTHSTSDYSRVPTTLEDDPVYKRHRSDWVNFHTRYVAPDRFRNALRNK